MFRNPSVTKLHVVCTGVSKASVGFSELAVWARRQAEDSESAYSPSP